MTSEWREDRDQARRAYKEATRLADVYATYAREMMREASDALDVIVDHELTQQESWAAIDAINEVRSQS